MKFTPLRRQADIQAIPKRSPVEEGWVDNHFLCRVHGRVFVSNVWIKHGILVVSEPGKSGIDVPLGMLDELYHIEVEGN
jgi:hypothetical protein